MATHLVEPGTILADRYVVEDLLAEEGESHSWRARDRVLARSVVLQVVPSSSPVAADMLAAAKHASRVADPRILQVLDAVDDGELSYVVREWASGQSLDVILSEGPLSARRAAWLLREVAAAMAKAHRMGLPHRRLAPDTVVVTRSSGVKVIGLGTFAALLTDPGHPDAEHPDDPELDDTQDLGRLLYACLTARWPGNGYSGLPEAPTEHGRLLLPRQVRAGVPRPLDTLCDRILGDPPRYGEPVTTVAEVKELLTQILADDGFGTTPGAALHEPPTNTPTRPLVGPPPAILGADPETSGDVTGEQPPFVPSPPTPAGEAASPLGRTLMWSVIAVLVLAAMLLAYLVGQQGLTDEESTSPATSGGQTTAGQEPLRPIKIVGAQDFDPLPEGSGDENPDSVGLAIDADKSTAWETLYYEGDPQLGGLKPGVGLILDLGQQQEVQRVTVTLQGQPTSLQLRAAAAGATSMPLSSVDEYSVVGSQQDAGTTATFSLDQPTATRYLLVWLTSLPNDGGDRYRGRIADVQVLG